MPSTIHPLGSSFAAALRDALRDLANRPTLLASLLVLIHAIATPYCGIVHDSQLYSGLVLNRIDPSFWSEDLFFRYGSQDNFSLFSPLMAPWGGVLSDAQIWDVIAFVRSLATPAYPGTVP